MAAKKCKSCGNVTFKRADITHIKCRDGRFDKVVAGNVIHLLPEPEKALRELERVVKPGGRSLSRLISICRKGPVLQQ